MYATGIYSIIFNATFWDRTDRNNNAFFLLSSLWFGIKKKNALLFPFIGSQIYTNKYKKTGVVFFSQYFYQKWGIKNNDVSLTNEQEGRQETFDRRRLRWNFWSVGGYRQYVDDVKSGQDGTLPSCSMFGIC